MSKKFIMLISAVTAVVLSLFYLSRPKTEPQETTSTQTTQITSFPEKSQEFAPFTAAFAIFTNGTFRIFSASMYHNLSPDVYIEAKNPNIVNVVKENVTWNDFFATLPMKLTKDCLTTGTGQVFCTGKSGELKFYINGKRDNNALVKAIQPGDKLLVTFGRESNEDLESQFAQIPNTPN